MPLLATALAFFFALTITDISPQTISNSDDVVTIFASASGLQNTTQYLEVTMTKDGESTDYFGWTQNNSGEWYQYKTSFDPTYFFNFLPVSSTWSGQLSAKIDTSDSGFKGPGLYLLKLAKFITTSASYSNAVGLTVNITQPVSSPSETSPSPVIDWSVGNRYELGEIFGANVKLLNFDSESLYYLKLRGGLEENTMNKMQTENSLAYFADTENWSKFPLVKTNSQGDWNGEIRGQVGEDQVEGKYKIRVRAHKKDTGTSVDSAVKEAAFFRQIAASIKLPPDEEESFLLASESADILGTNSAEVATGSPGFPDVSPPGETQGGGTTLVVAGMISLGLSAVLLYNRRS